MLFKTLINLRTISTQLNVTNSFYRFKTPTKGKVSLSSKHSVKADELLHNQLNTVVVPVKVLECLLKTNSQKINGKNIIDATDGLVTLYKQDRSFRRENILIIEQILHTLISEHKDKIQTTEAIEILKNITKIRILESPEVVNTILEIINNSIQDLEFKDYNFISEILNFNLLVKKTDLIKTINDNLKKQFIVKMSTDFDGDNLDLLTEILRYASNNLLDKMIFQIIIDTLKSDNFKTVPIENAISIMKSLCTIPKYSLAHKWDEVLPRIQNSLINNIDRLPTKDAISILYKMSLRIREDRIEEYYNPTLLDLFAQKLVLNDVGLEIALQSLRNFMSVRHVPKKLLSYISAKHYETKGNERKLNHRTSIDYLEKLLCLVNGLGDLKYKPIFWEEIYIALKTPKILTFSDEMLVNYALHLSCLSCYDFSVLERIFKAQYNYKEQQFLHWRLLYLWQNIKTNSNYNGPLPPQEMIDSFNSLDRINHCPLIPSLKEILPDDRYFKTNLRTKLHHQVDHVVAYKGKDNPVAINDNDDETEGEQYLEDLKVPDNTKIISLLFLPRWWYLAYADEILGPYQAYVQSLETLTRNIVVIPEQVWFQLPEDSRPEFLKNAINTKLNNIINQNS